MNDRFKFRAKRCDNNRFVYGYLVFIYIDNPKKARIYCPDDTFSYDVYTDTLGQCTGLKDKNGKFIYEADIVTIADDWGVYGIMAGEKTEVYFDKLSAGFRLKLQFTDSVGPWVEDTECLEVIGNIHEIEDLLNEGLR